MSLKETSFESRREGDRLLGLNIDFEAMQPTFRRLVEATSDLKFPV
jgi:hypothetical protein